MSETVTFDGRVVIVTGAGGGMGRAHAELLASRGARVVVNDVRNADTVVSAIAARGETAVADAHDVSTEDGAQQVIQTAVGAYGGVDGLINNAGISISCPFPDVSWEVFDRTLKVNTYGPFFLTKHAWPHLARSGAGRVVMVASKASLMGGAPNVAHYGASKGALLALTRQLAATGMAQGIAVNAVLPSALTNMTGREGDDITDAVRKHPLAPQMAEQLQVDLADPVRLMQRSTEVVSSFVAWLCHPDCASNGEFFNVVGGDVARLTFGMGAGLTDPNLTIEVVRDRFEVAMDLTDTTLLPAIRPL